jgi:hypothetical protein
MSIKFTESLLKTRRFIFFAALVASLSGFSQTVFASACADTKAESAWIEETVRVWEKTRREALFLPAAELPWMLLFDESCVWHVNPETAVLKPDAKSRIAFNPQLAEVYLTRHDGKITLPTGEQIPAQLLSFASVYGAARKSFFVSAMPAIWHKAPHLKDEPNRDALVKSVFMHEMTHTLHRNIFARLDEIEKLLPKIENFDDDIIQNAFGKRDDFRAAYENERDLLYRAAAETNRARRRELAKKALAAINARRQKHFTGTDAVYREIEEIFLTMEGAANWAAYRAARIQGLNEPDALKLIRRSGKRWSQDEGLALFLVVDSLSPRWQKKAFGKQSATITDLLAEALR